MNLKPQSVGLGSKGDGGDTQCNVRGEELSKQCISGGGRVER